MTNQPTKRPGIRNVKLQGSAAARGEMHGQIYADEIHEFTRSRIGLIADGVWGGFSIDRGEVLEIANSMLSAHADFDDSLHVEMLAMAAAAGITPAEAIIVGGFTDFVDTVRAVHGDAVQASVAEDDCTALIVPNERADGAGFLAQTWDMHEAATDRVVLFELRPIDGPAALVFSTTGCLGQIGMNEAGVAVGINNLNAADGRMGVTWPSVVRAMLRTSSAAAALEVLESANLAGAHNYQIFDRSGVGYNVEAMPSARVITDLEDLPIAHTNHTLDPEASRYQAEKEAPLLDSSLERLEAATRLLAEVGSDRAIDVKALTEIMSDPKVCQIATPPFLTESAGAVIMRPRNLGFWACWGPPSVNEMKQFSI